MNLPFDSRSLSLFASLIVRLSPLPRRVQIAQEGRLPPGRTDSVHCPGEV